MAKQYNFYNLQFPPIFEHFVSRRNDIHKGRHKCFTLIHESISNSEKKNMYYTRMLLARCNNALMSGIIDSFFYVKVHVEGEKN